MSHMSKSINQRWTSREMFALFVLGLVGGVVLGWTFILAAAPAYSAPDPVVSTSSSSWSQPYGGCAEAHAYPKSIGAAECRAHGWIVKWWVVVSPNDRLEFWSPDMGQCANEDRGRFCSWNFYAPRREGLDLWYDGQGRRHYVKQVTQ